jgi:hypothetical protein
VFWGGICFDEEDYKDKSGKSQMRLQLHIKLFYQYNSMDGKRAMITVRRQYQSRV